MTLPPGLLDIAIHREGYPSYRSLGQKLEVGCTYERQHSIDLQGEIAKGAQRAMVERLHLHQSCLMQNPLSFLGVLFQEPQSEQPLDARVAKTCTKALVGFQGRGLADGVQPDFCHPLFLEALIFQQP